MSGWNNDTAHDDYAYVHDLLKEKGLRSGEYQIYVLKPTGAFYPKGVTSYVDATDGYLITKNGEHFHFATDLNPQNDEMEIVIWQMVAPIDFWKSYPPYQQARKILGI